MNDADVARLMLAVESINEFGDPEPFVRLMAEDMTWSGAPQGWFWRRYTPS